MRSTVKAQRFPAAGIPDTEKQAGVGILRRSLHLLRRAITRNQDERVDVALIQPTEREVAATDSGENPQQRQVAARLRAETQTAVGARQRGGEQPERVHLLEFRPWSLVAVTVGVRRDRIGEALRSSEKLPRGPACRPLLVL